MPQAQEWKTYSLLVFKICAHQTHKQKARPQFLRHLLLLLTGALYGGASWFLVPQGPSLAPPALLAGLKASVGAPWTLTCCGEGWPGNTRVGQTDRTSFTRARDPSGVKAAFYLALYTYLRSSPKQEQIRMERHLRFLYSAITGEINLPLTRS